MSAAALARPVLALPPAVALLALVAFAPVAGQAPPLAPPSPPAALQLRLHQAPGNSTIAGTPVVPPPIVHLTDAHGERVLVHSPARVVAQYQAIVYSGALTGEATTSSGQPPPGTAITQLRSAFAPLVNGSANFSDALVITYAAQGLVLHFSVEGADGAPLPSPGVAPLAAPPGNILPAAPTDLVVLHTPIGGLRCTPFGLPPKVAIKDAFNNTISDLDGLSLRATIADGDVALTGSPTAGVVDGVATFDGLGVNTSALAFHVSFAVEEPSPPPPPPGAPPSLPGAPHCPRRRPRRPLLTCRLASRRPWFRRLRFRRPMRGRVATSAVAAAVATMGARVRAAARVALLSTAAATPRLAAPRAHSRAAALRSPRAAARPPPTQPSRQAPMATTRWLTRRARSRSASRRPSLVRWTATALPFALSSY